MLVFVARSQIRRLPLGKNGMLNAIVDFSIIVANLGGVLSGLLMLNYVFPGATEECPPWAKPLFRSLAALGAIVVVVVLIQNADQISPGAWACPASTPPPS
jgi:hypothetical protein